MWQYTTAGMKVNWEPLLQRGKELYARLYTCILTYFKFVPSSGKKWLDFSLKKPLPLVFLKIYMTCILFLVGIFTIAYAQKHYSFKRFIFIIIKLKRTAFKGKHHQLVALPIGYRCCKKACKNCLSRRYFAKPSGQAGWRQTFL